MNAKGLVTGLLAGLLGCGSTGASGSAPEPDASQPDTTRDGSAPPADGGAPPPDGAPLPDGAQPGADSDQDGIDDAHENAWASAYLPFISLSPGDKCKTHGVLARVSPHPHEKGRVMLWYDLLYDADCGANGHAGDDETMGVVIDPAKPAPDGILAVRAISHQGTPCERVTTCGQCPGMSACAKAKRDGRDYPVLFPSIDKHGNYVDMATCTGSIVCDFGGCALSASADAPPIVNAGEPAHPLVHDLTKDGFVTTANGWTHAELMGFDPWKPGNFGGAGDVSKDLVDEAFVIDTTKCP